MRLFGFERKLISVWGLGLAGHFPTVLLIQKRLDLQGKSASAKSTESVSQPRGTLIDLRGLPPAGFWKALPFVMQLQQAFRVMTTLSEFVTLEYPFNRLNCRPQDMENCQWIFLTKSNHYNKHLLQALSNFRLRSDQKYTQFLNQGRRDSSHTQVVRSILPITLRLIAMR